MKSILIVDDEDKIRTIYSSLLKEEGYTVATAANAIEATRKLIREHFDLVLLDIKMPEIDGEKMFDVIKEYNPKMKVIIISVYPREEQIIKASFAHDYFDKSQDTGVLVDKVRKVLGTT